MKLKSYFIFVLLIIVNKILLGQYPNQQMNDQFMQIYRNNYYNISYEEAQAIFVIDNYIFNQNASFVLPKVLDQYTKFDLPSKNPKAMISEYNYRLSEINVQCDQMRSQMEARVSANVDIVVNWAEKELRRLNVKATTGNVYADLLIKEAGKEVAKKAIMDQKQKKINAERRKAEAELDRQLKSKMEPIRDEMLDQNGVAMNQYLYAAAYAISEKEEEAYVNYYNFHQCVYNKISQNYNYKRTDWMKPNCTAPVEMRTQPNPADPDYAVVALRKYNLYNKYRKEIFIESTKQYLDIAIGSNPKNANIYLLKVKLSDNIIDKKFSITVASRLDKTNTEVSAMKNKIDREYNEALYRSIKQGKYSFVQQSVKNGLQYNVLNSKGETPAVYAIIHDKEKIFELLIQDEIQNQEKEKINSYQVFACINGSIKCQKKLLVLGADINYREEKYNSIPLLNIAMLNEQSEMCIYLLEQDLNIDTALQFAKNKSQERYTELLHFLAAQNNHEFDQIILDNDPHFFINNFSKIEINTNHDDAIIIINNKKTGKGNYTIPRAPINDKYLVKVKKAGYKAEEKEVELKPKTECLVKIEIQKYNEELLPLLTLKDLGFKEKSWLEYYKDPENLKRDTKQNANYNQRLLKKAEAEAKTKADQYNRHINNELKKKK